MIPGQREQEDDWTFWRRVYEAEIERERLVSLGLKEQDDTRVDGERLFEGQDLPQRATGDE